MGNQFDPANSIVRQCMAAMILANSGNLLEAKEQVLSTWNQAEDNFEKFLAAYFVARYQDTKEEQIIWFKKSLEFALLSQDEGARSAFSSVFHEIAECYQSLGDDINTKKYTDLASAQSGLPLDKGPFYHGTKADLQLGDFLIPGGESNYKADLKMNHIYFTANPKGAELAAALAKGDGPQRIYIVEPTGEFENDPNLTDKKFPGNLTRSYRSQEPLKILGEEIEWSKKSAEEIQQWHDKLDKNKGEIIN